MLPCGHPAECLDHDDDCQWCAEVAALKRGFRECREQVGKTAIVVEGGTVSLRAHTIGLVEVRGGLVNFLPLAPRPPVGDGS